MYDKKNLLGTQEICEIIKQCGLSGVVELSYGGLKLTLGKPPEPPTIEAPTYSDPVGQVTNSQTREAIEEEQARSAQSELDQLLINDPEEFERLIRRGDLVDEGT